MTPYIIRRLIQGICILLIISVVVFALANVAIDPAIAIAGEGANGADVEAARTAYGLDQPILKRYFEWLIGVTTGDLGESFRQHRPVATIVGERLPVTLRLGIFSTGFALLVSIPLGVLSASRSGGWIDRLATVLIVLGQSVPSFWLSLMCIAWFAVSLRWLPVSGMIGWQSYIIPVFALGMQTVPPLLQVTRAGMVRTLQSDYIRTARAKGLRERTVLFKHALRGALVPLVSITYVQFGYLIAGSVVVETIFALEGIGYLAWDAAMQSDTPVIQGLVMVTASFYVALTLLADVLNSWLDPKLRTGWRGELA